LTNYKIFELYAIGWAPDYLSPYNILEPLFNPISFSNIALVNDSKLNAMMSLALETTDDEARDTIYKNIQGYMTYACFHAPLYHSKVIWSHSADLRNVPYNALGSLEFYEVYR
jgi:ABC-type transport system substrate-binding protein